MEDERVGELEVHQDLEFERRNWLIQRLGWVLMALAILAGAVGVFGRGPLSSASATSAGGVLRVEYERVTRHASPTHLLITVAPSAVEGGALRLLVSRPYLASMQVEQIQPAPASVLVAGDHLLYTFAADPGGPAHISFSITPDTYNRQRADVALADGRERVRFLQFVFP